MKKNTSTETMILDKIVAYKNNKKYLKIKNKGNRPRLVTY